MATDKGLPPVPSNLPRPLAVYLQAMHGCVTRLAGVARGSASTQAVRRYEKREFASPATTTTTTQVVADTSVDATKLVDGAVSTSKIADQAVIGEKIANSTIKGTHLVEGGITKRELAPDAVTETSLCNASVGWEHIQNGAVTEEKIVTGLLPIFIHGVASDGEIITLPGPWARQPIIAISGVIIPCPTADGSFSVGTENARQNEQGDWLYDAVARTSSGDVGTMQWFAIGYNAQKEVSLP